MADDRWSLGLEEATLQKLVEKNGDTASMPTDAPVQAVDDSAAHDGQKKTDGSHNRTRDKDRHHSREKEATSRSSKSREGTSDRKSRKEPRDETVHARSDAQVPARDSKERTEKDKMDKLPENTSRSSHEVSNRKHDAKDGSRSDGRDASKSSDKKREELLPEKEGSAKRAKVEDPQKDKDKDRDRGKEKDKDKDRDRDKEKKQKDKYRDADRDGDRSRDKHDNDADKNKDSRNGSRDDDKTNGRHVDRSSYKSSERSKSARRERSRSRSPRKRRRSRSRSPGRRSRRSASPRRRRSRSSSARRHRSRTKSITPPPLNPKYRRFGGGSSGLGGYSPRRRIGGDDRSPTPLPSPEKRTRARARAWDQAPPGLEGMSATQAVQAAVTTPNMAGVNPILMMPQLAQQMSAMQAQTRPLRRLYVGNVPTTSNEAELMAFFNTLMTTSRCQHIPGTQPVSSVSLFVDKAYAFLEFLTPEDAAAALNFDGVIYNGSVLKVRRPKDYPALQTVLGPLLPPAPIVDLLDKDVSDGPNKIFVGGIPHSVDREKVKEIVTAFGQLKGFSMVMDLETGNHQGRAFLEYKDSSVTTRAVAGLNGMALGEGILTVCLATPDAQEPQVAEQGERLNFYGVPEHAKPLMETPQRIIELSNVVTMDDLIDDEAVSAIEEDIRLECARWGTVKSAHIPRPDAETIALELEKRAQEAAASSEVDDQDGEAQLPADSSLPSPPGASNTDQSHAPASQEHGDEPAGAHGNAVLQDNQPTPEQPSMQEQQSHEQAAPAAVVVKQEEPEPSASEVTQQYNAPVPAALPGVTVKQEVAETELHPAAQQTDGDGSEVTQPVVKTEATEALPAGSDGGQPQDTDVHNQLGEQALAVGASESAESPENGMRGVEVKEELAQGEEQANAQPAAPAAVNVENGMPHAEGKVEDVPEAAHASAAQPADMPAPAAVNGLQEKKKREPKGLFKVYVEFSRESSAVQAAHVLHGRLYNGRKVSVRYFPLRLYQMHFRKGLVATTHEEKQALALAAQARITAHLPDY